MSFRYRYDETLILDVGEYTIWWEKPGVIGPGPTWCCLYGCWGHYTTSLWGLFWDVYQNYRSDHNLVG